MVYKLHTLYCTVIQITVNDYFRFYIIKIIVYFEEQWTPIPIIVKFNHYIHFLNYKTGTNNKSINLLSCFDKHVYDLKLFIRNSNNKLSNHTYNSFFNYLQKTNQTYPANQSKTKLK